MAPIKNDKNGRLSIPVWFINTVLGVGLAAGLSIMVSLVVWWTKHAAHDKEVITRLSVVETEINRGILRVAEVRMSAVEIRLDSIDRTLLRIDTRLNKLNGGDHEK